MSARIVHVTALLPQTHRLLGLPGLRVFRGTVRRRAIPRCDGRCGGERLTTSQTAGVSALSGWRGAAGRKLCLNCACGALQNLNFLVRVGPVGLEPTTYGLKVRSSAN
jgi:hypothetical protein